MDILICNTYKSTECPKSMFENPAFGPWLRNYAKDKADKNVITVSIICFN